MSKKSMCVRSEKSEEKKELFDEFSLVGKDDCSDVEYAITAQNEVLANKIE